MLRKVRKIKCKKMTKIDEKSMIIKNTKMYSYLIIFFNCIKQTQLDFIRDSAIMAGYLSILYHYVHITIIIIIFKTKQTY